MGALAVGAGVSLLQTGIGLHQKNKAEQEYKDHLKTRPDPTNPYATSRIATQGGLQQMQQSQRRMATLADAASRSGSRGLSALPSIGREDAMVSQNVAANFDQQAAQIQQLQARGEIIRQQQELDMWNQETEGYANKYNAGQANMMGGLSNFAGTMASGLSDVGALQGGAQASRPMTQGAYVAPTAPSTFGFQPLTIG